MALSLRNSSRSLSIDSKQKFQSSLPRMAALFLLISLCAIPISDLVFMRTGLAVSLDSVHFVNDRVGWAAAYDQIARTEDGGETWKVSPVYKLREQNQIIWFIGLVSHDEKRVWAISDSDFNYLSKDGGETWAKVDNDKDARSASLTGLTSNRRQPIKWMNDVYRAVNAVASGSLAKVKPSRSQVTRPGVLAERKSGHVKPGNDQVQTVSYCDLVNNKEKFYGKLVRVTATLFTNLDSECFSDPTCSDECVYPVLDCDDDEECSRLEKMLNEKSELKGDVSRVLAVLVGRLQPPRNPRRNRRSEFVFRTVEEAHRIPSYVP